MTDRMYVEFSVFYPIFKKGSLVGSGASCGKVENLHYGSPIGTPVG